MHRFFVPATVRTATAVTLTGGIAHQIARVLRLRANEEIILIPTDGQDAVEWRVRLDTVEARLVSGAVIAERPGLPEPGCAVTLCAAVLKGERFDWLVQKATELGVATIQPVITAQTIRRVGPEDTKALERWRRIATEAAEQSGRSRVPMIGTPVSLADIASSVACTALRRTRGGQGGDIDSCRAAECARPVGDYRARGRPGRERSRAPGTA